mmetsp:Transcript_38791/g.105035  ORF Transcript_38791/g.105035 Transcript_38791/m.105035 type:complete len:189 (-) Transcript_38791:51-617(-)
MATAPRCTSILLLVTLGVECSVALLIEKAQPRDDVAHSMSGHSGEAWALHATAAQRSLHRAEAFTEDRELAEQVFEGWRAKFRDLVKELDEENKLREDERHALARRNAELRLELEGVREALSRTETQGNTRYVHERVGAREAVNIMTNIYTRILEERANRSLDAAGLEAALARREHLNATSDDDGVVF